MPKTSFRFSRDFSRRKPCINIVIELHDPKSRLESSIFQRRITPDHFSFWKFLTQIKLYLINESLCISQSFLTIFGIQGTALGKCLRTWTCIYRCSEMLLNSIRFQYAKSSTRQKKLIIFSKDMAAVVHNHPSPDVHTIIIIIIDRFYIALFSAIEQIHCACMWFYMSE